MGVREESVGQSMECYTTRQCLPEILKQNLMELVRKTNLVQYCVLKSRRVLFESCLSSGKLSCFSAQVPSACNEILSIRYASHVICYMLGSQVQHSV